LWLTCNVIKNKNIKKYIEKRKKKEKQEKQVQLPHLIEKKRIGVVRIVSMGTLFPFHAILLPFVIVRQT
jgi:hypothetical protein